MEGKKESKNFITKLIKQLKIKESSTVDFNLLKTLVFKHDLNSLKLLLKNSDFDLKTTDPVDGSSLLHHAALIGHIEMAKFFLQKNKELLILKDLSENLPLHIAIEKDNFPLIDLFRIECSIDYPFPNPFIQSNSKGETPLDLLLRKKCYFDYVTNYFPTYVSSKENKKNDSKPKENTQYVNFPLDRSETMASHQKRVSQIFYTPVGSPHTENVIQPLPNFELLTNRRVRHSVHHQEIPTILKPSTPNYGNWRDVSKNILQQKEDANHSEEEDFPQLDSL